MTAPGEPRQAMSYRRFVALHTARMGLVLILAVLAGLINGRYVLSGVVFAIWLVALGAWMRLRGSSGRALLRR